MNSDSIDTRIDSMSPIRQHTESHQIVRLSCCMPHFEKLDWRAIFLVVETAEIVRVRIPSSLQPFQLKMTRRWWYFSDKLIIDTLCRYAIAPTFVDRFHWYFFVRILVDSQKLWLYIKIIFRWECSHLKIIREIKPTNDTLSRNITHKNENTD